MHISLIGLANLLSGLYLVAPATRSFAGDFFQNARTRLEPYRTAIGMTELGIGAVSLIGRATWSYSLGGGYLESLAGVGLGFTIGYPALAGIPQLYEFGKKIEPYEKYIGAAGIAFGIVAMF